MSLKGFKDYIVEAFRTKDLEKAAELIQRYLSKKLGPLYKDPEPEVFKKSNGQSGYGIRYYLDNGKSIRFNWIKGIKSDGISSIDVWSGPDATPKISVDTEGLSVAKFLPALVTIVTTSQLGEYQIENIDCDDDKYILEGKIDDVMALLQKGHTSSQIKKAGYSNGTVYQARKKLGMVNSVTAEKAPGEKVELTPITIQNIKLVEDDLKVYEQKMEDLHEMAVALTSGAINSLLITGKAGTGKTFTIEKTFKKLGLKEGVDWMLVKAGVSAIGAYQVLYKWRERIVVFDDADGIFKTDEGRNLLKSALDDKDIRRLSWMKESNTVFPAELEMTDPEEFDKLRSKGKVPNSFDFQGSVVFISNMSKDKADPDKAIQSRSMVIDINPSLMAIKERMRILLPKLGPPGMSMKDKKEVLKYVEEGGSSELTLRKFTKSAKLKQAGIKGWARFAKEYA